MATKGGREKIKLESTAGTGHFYTTSKNKKTMPEKMLIKKFDPKARKHVDYKEMKLKESSIMTTKKTRLGGFFVVYRFISRSGHTRRTQLERELSEGGDATFLSPVTPGLQIFGQLVA